MNSCKVTKCVRDSIANYLHYSTYNIFDEFDGNLHLLTFTFQDKIFFTNI